MFYGSIFLIVSGFFSQSTNQLIESWESVRVVVGLGVVGGWRRLRLCGLSPPHTSGWLIQTLDSQENKRTQVPAADEQADSH